MTDLQADLAANLAQARNDIDRAWGLGDTHPCPWCEEPTDEDGSLFACMIAHCVSCLAVCRSCQDDMQKEGLL